MGACGGKSKPTGDPNKKNEENGKKGGLQIDIPQVGEDANINPNIQPNSQSKNIPVLDSVQPGFGTGCTSQQLTSMGNAMNKFQCGLDKKPEANNQFESNNQANMANTWKGNENK